MIPEVPQRRIGTRTVRAIALGGARWSLVDRPDESLAEATIRAALAEGVNLFDTARAYTTTRQASHNETLLGTVLAEELAAGSAVISTKGGHGRLGSGDFYVDGRPTTLRRHCEDSLRFLGIDRIPLYSLHWPDPEVPISESVGVLADLRTQGKVEMIGLCNVSVEQLEAAVETAHIDAVQHRFSPIDQARREVVDLCATLGIPFLAYSPFGGAAGAPTLGRHQGITDVCARTGATPYQVAVAWLLGHPGVIPIVGAGRPSSITGLFPGITLTDDEVAAINDSDPDV